jgi:hypothetical protein
MSLMSGNARDFRGSRTIFLTALSSAPATPDNPNRNSSLSRFVTAPKTQGFYHVSRIDDRFGAA